MNIDIVNKQIANNLKINEKDVAQVNDFYWRCIHKHLKEYNPRPVNLEGLCSFYPHRKLIKSVILKYIKAIRTITLSPKYKFESKCKKESLYNYKDHLRNLLKIRKYYKFTN